MKKLLALLLLLPCLLCAQGTKSLATGTGSQVLVGRGVDGADFWNDATNKAQIALSLAGSFQPLDARLTGLAAATYSAGQIVVATTGSTFTGTTTFTGTAALGTMAYQNVGSFATAAQGATADALSARLAGSGTLTVTGAASISGTTSGLQSGTNSGDNFASSTVLISGGTLSVNTGTGSTQIPTNANAAALFIAKTSGTGEGTAFTGSVTLNLTTSGTYPPLSIVQNGGAGFASEVNETHFVVNSTGNVLTLQNTNTTGCSALTVDQPGTTNEIGAFCGGGNTGVRSLLIEASNIDVDNIGGNSSATPFFLRQTTSYSGQVTFGGYDRIVLDGAGQFNLNNRVGSPAVILSSTTGVLALTPGSITSTSPATFAVNTGTTGTNRTGFSVAETWSATANEGTYNHTPINSTITTQTSSNITTGPFPGGVNAFTGMVANNASGNISYAAVYSAWVRNLASGTISNACAYYVRGPNSGTSSPIGTVTGLYIEPLKITGVTSGYGIQQTGTNDQNTFSGSLNTYSGKVVVSGSLTALNITGSNSGDQTLGSLGGQASIVKISGTLSAGSATISNANLTSSPVNAWAQDNASSITNVGILTVTVSGTTATITSTTGALDSSPFTLFIAP